MAENHTPQSCNHAGRLRHLKALVAQRADTDWGQEAVQLELGQDPDSPDARCPRFAGILEESGDRAVILAETEEELAEEMAARLTSEIPIRPIELVDLDTHQQRLAFCNATVRFTSPEPRPEAPLIRSRLTRHEIEDISRATDERLREEHDERQGDAEWLLDAILLRARADGGCSSPDGWKDTLLGRQLAAAETHRRIVRPDPLPPDGVVRIEENSRIAKAAEQIAFREQCADPEAEELRQIARNALGWGGERDADSGAHDDTTRSPAPA